jgi:hypothetical protein
MDAPFAFFDQKKRATCRQVTRFLKTVWKGIDQATSGTT